MYAFMSASEEWSSPEKVLQFVYLIEVIICFSFLQFQCQLLPLCH